MYTLEPGNDKNISGLAFLVCKNVQLDGICASSNFNFKLSSFIGFFQTVFDSPATHEEI